MWKILARVIDITCDIRWIQSKSLRKKSKGSWHKVIEGDVMGGIEGL